MEKGTWEYLGNQSLLIEVKGSSYLVKQGFFDEHVLAIKLDSSERFAFFINENKYGKELNSIEDIVRFLEDRYLRDNAPAEGGLKYVQKAELRSSKLSVPNEWVRQMLLTNSETLVQTTINWKQFCDSHSEFYPLYTYQELVCRGVVIPPVLKLALDDYARYRKFASFEEMKKYYFDCL